MENELNKFKTFDLSYFIGKSHFEEDGTQNYLIFQPIIRNFKVNTITNTDYVSSWKSKGLSTESIVYELGASTWSDSDPTLKNCLFGAVTLNKNVDIDMCGYYGYGIGFDIRSNFSFPSGGFGQNVLIFGAVMSSSTHIDNKKKDILILGIGPTQRLEHTLTIEKMYSNNFTATKKKFCPSLHYNGVNS